MARRLVGPRVLIVTDDVDRWGEDDNVHAVRPGAPLLGRRFDRAYLEGVELTPDLVEWLRTAVLCRIAPRRG